MRPIHRRTQGFGAEHLLPNFVMSTSTRCRMPPNSVVMPPQVSASSVCIHAFQGGGDSRDPDAVLPPTFADAGDELQIATLVPGQQGFAERCLWGLS